MEAHISETDIHIWHINLETNHTTFNVCFGSLSKEEQERAARFSNTAAKNRYCISHGALRYIISKYVNEKPELIHFIAQRYGKPALEPCAQIRFNLSHSRSAALVAIAKNREVGVDIQFEDKSIDMLGIANRFFSAIEKKILCSLDKSEIPHAFYRYWVRKEAFTKALGQGIIVPLDSFAVPLENNGLVEFESSSVFENSSRIWSIHHVKTKPGYHGAIAIEGADYTIKEHFWDNA